MSKVTSVREQWEVFAKAVLPHDCSATQRKEMRRAFVAGCWSMFQEHLEIMTWGSDEESLEAMNSLEQEMIAYKELVKRGLD